MLCIFVLNNKKTDDGPIIFNFMLGLRDFFSWDSTTRFCQTRKSGSGVPALGCEVAVLIKRTSLSF